MACEFQVSSVFAPTSGLRVAGTSQTGGRRQGRVPPLAKLDFLERRRSRIVWASPSTGHAGMGREGGQRGGVTVPARHFFSETLRLRGTGIATMRPEPLYVGPSGVYVGAMFAHLGVMLWLCCHILAPCWTMLRAMLDRRVPPEVILGYVVFMTSPSFLKFCLKKLPPVACEAPTSFLQHYFFEKAESCWGRAHPR